MFFAATSLLPSTFTMYMLTAAAAFVLEGRPRHVVATAIVGVIWGWPVAGDRQSMPYPMQQALGPGRVCPVPNPQQLLYPAVALSVMQTAIFHSWGLPDRAWCAGLAFAPYAAYVLLAPRLPRSIGWGLTVLVVTTAPVILFDKMLYGAWTVSCATMPRKACSCWEDRLRIAVIGSDACSAMPHVLNLMHHLSTYTKQAILASAPVGPPDLAAIETGPAAEAAINPTGMCC